MEISNERIINISPIDDEYLCPICVHLLWKPVECQNCQRVFCKNCIDKCLKEKPNVCPLCQHYQEKRCSPLLYALLCKFKIVCENKHNGCDDILPYESLEKHQQEQCQYQMKICRGCQNNVLKKDLDQHEQKCGEITIECKRCKLVYKKRETHEQLDCVMNMLNQSNKKIESLEKLVENLQQNVQKLETSSNLHSLTGWPSSSVAHDVPLSSLVSSWNIIYDHPYSHVTTIADLRALISQCNKQIMVGAIQGSSSMILKIAAMGPLEILSLNSPLNQPTTFGNVNWYLTPSKSFGFAPSSTTINCSSADYDESDNTENRLSWHLQGDGGWRAGTAKSLNNNSEWRKIIMTMKN
ncbi:unnamed protein product [Rotaria magnacalcarata]|uniref:RING-type domain-containing protein n=1 Tax=Rotaria magnacalcarata TaxID=392030 RepID=A0A819J9R6_9BILA|nr:unnamed protein product [Rotaria magnacalcarata]CAF1983546.1 unnamed protein product [Rotaria magnacalcarata]CAF3898233.1 unnamed protein product [Rotaria magnacalcarata]CAF3925632.1 unnamed protein product [Rotaria magnacalcarata]